VLQRAYASHEFLGERLRSLGLLEQFGKNAWLIGNATLEDELKALEAQLKDVKQQVETVEEARRTAQESVAGELQALQEGWRQGVSRMIEVEVAAENLRQEILEKQRQAAQG
jgi:pre-mRNA-splicing factor SPF27